MLWMATHSSEGVACGNAKDPHAGSRWSLAKHLGGIFYHQCVFFLSTVALLGVDGDLYFSVGQ
jgi:hypothetical protein